MKGYLLVLIIVILGETNAADEPEFVYPEIFNDPVRDAFYYGNFPDDFAWSSATSSYQIEGGWDANGKGVNIWDTFTHQGGNVHNNDTGDVACDSYNKYKEDVQLMVAMGLKYYRFSLSWARMLPDGTINNKNPDGLRYYNDLINELLANDITPMVTLYHWDLPQVLQDQGGWANESIIDHFDDYAAYSFESFGDRVKFWLTFNEPWVVALAGHETAQMAPGIADPGVMAYIVGHTIIKAHAKAWHNYDDNFRSAQQGRCGITLNSDFFTPTDPDNPGHVEAAETSQQFMLGWFASSIYKNGHYPDVLREKIDSKSAEQGFAESRLPTFTDDEATYIYGTSDFFGLNHYTTLYSEDVAPDSSLPLSYWKDQDTYTWQDPQWPDAESSWHKSVPWGVRGLLNWIKNEYGSEWEIYITENGFSTADIYDLSDDDRVRFYRGYINEVLKAIDIDDVNCKGYTAWSLMDNFEWAEGYGERFGMHYVDFNDPERKREQKDSAKVYAQIVAENGFNAAGPSFVVSSTLIWFSVACSVLSIITIMRSN